MYLSISGKLYTNRISSICPAVTYIKGTNKNERINWSLNCCIFMLKTFAAFSCLGQINLKRLVVRKICWGVFCLFCCWFFFRGRQISYILVQNILCANCKDSIVISLFVYTEYYLSLLEILWAAFHYTGKIRC